MTSMFAGGSIQQSISMAVKVKWVAQQGKLAGLQTIQSSKCKNRNNQGIFAIHMHLNLAFYDLKFENELIQELIIVMYLQVRILIALSYILGKREYKVHTFLCTIQILQYSEDFKKSTQCWARIVRTNKYQTPRHT